tara:strand:+ start:8481 stop:9302 length:822 start_codon:yes stop_codon:yes gene_type:complete
MKKFFKKIRIIRRLYDAYVAFGYFNNKYYKIIKWAIVSNENTNYTYKLTKKNQLELIKLFEGIFENSNFNQIKSYLEELEFDKEIRNYVKESISVSKFKNFADLNVEFSRRLGWYICARLLKPKIIIETGVDKGLGAIILIKALMKNQKEGYSGYYYGIDINHEAGYLLKGAYKKYGEILYGDSIESLKGFNLKIDLFINDSDHSDQYEYKEYLTIKNKLSKEGIILGDNSHESDKLLNFSIENDRGYSFFKEEPLDHWYPGAGIGISYPRKK